MASSAPSPGEPDWETHKLDLEIDSMNAFWMTGLRGWDYGPWADYGLRGVDADRRGESGVAGLEGDALASALSGMEPKPLGWALGLSEEVSELDPRLEGGNCRREASGSLVRPWSRLLFDPEREVFAALADDGVQAARLRIEWRERPELPVAVIRPVTWAPWELTRIFSAIDREAQARRASYSRCAHCGIPTPPARIEATDDGPVCRGCPGRRQ
jgi:hypothetical protein